MTVKTIPASELREGYTLVLSDGTLAGIDSLAVIVHVTLDNGDKVKFMPNTLVHVEAEEGEF